MDEPESIAGLRHAAHQEPVIVFLSSTATCNALTVRSRKCVITELEKLFNGCGWRVIKVMWGCGWDRVWQLDTQGIVRRALTELVDGKLQALYARGPQALFEDIVARYPDAASIVAQLSEQEIANCMPGGHDPVKVSTAYRKALEADGKPTVILAYTIKGYQLGSKTHSRNIAHNKKKMSLEDLRAYAALCEFPCLRLRSSQLSIITLALIVILLYTHDNKEHASRGIYPKNSE